jgi:hypothetical protein
MTITSLNCPSCGAPVAWQAGITVSACVYCNSSLRISGGENAEPIAAQMKEVSTATIDEVKRLLIAGAPDKAVNFYSKQAGIEYIEASRAVSAIRKTIGYKPPLNQKGIFMVYGLALISLCGLVGGVILLVKGLIGWGILLIVLAILFAGVNQYALGESVQAYLLLRRGIPARAMILKTWTIKPVTVGGVKGILMRLLLEAYPDQEMSFQAEANCLVSQANEGKFREKSFVEIRFSDDTPHKVTIVKIYNESI